MSKTFSDILNSNQSLSEAQKLCQHVFRGAKETAQQVYNKKQILIVTAGIGLGNKKDVMILCKIFAITNNNLSKKVSISVFALAWYHFEQRNMFQLCHS